MEKIFEKIWELALPYQDKRGDKGHAKITLHYALELLESEKGDEEVVIPAIILHDVGWNQLNEEEISVIFDLGKNKERELEVRYKHQKEGVRIAREILRQINYPKELVEEILEIISQHDTRESFISKNEGLVRDADKLWRFSKIGFNADIIRTKSDFKKWYIKSIKDIEHPHYLYSQKAKEIAYENLKGRKQGYENSE